MNLFKKIGSIFTKMRPARKVEKVAEIVQEEVTAAAAVAVAKVEPVHDIEDIVKGTKSAYFSPIQTRNQRAAKKGVIEPVPSLVHKAVLQSAKDLKPKPRETKKLNERKNLLEDVKQLAKADDGPLEVLQKIEVPAVALTKTVKTKSKKTVTEALAAEKPKSPSKQSVKAASVANKKPKVIVQEEVVEAKVSPLKGKRKSKETSVEPETKLEKWEPIKWAEILENVKLMRANVDAPVDTMGCHMCSDENADEKTKRFHILVALMLSSQTKDQVTYEAMKRLKENNCTPSNIADMDTQELEALLYPVSFYKNKAKYLKNTSKILVERYDSDIPNNVKELIKLPGVGPKMAHICMSSAWDIVTGIGVDVHVHRISNRLGWVRSETKEPEQTRKELESWLPLERWKEVNYLLVGFGQTICTPTKPKCTECLNNLICPSANVVKPKKLKNEKVS